MEWSASRPGRFTHGKRALDTYWIRGWVDPRAYLNTVEKRQISYPCRKSKLDAGFSEMLVHIGQSALSDITQHHDLTLTTLRNSNIVKNLSSVPLSTWRMMTSLSVIILDLRFTQRNAVLWDVTS
jgi:hypothetical protein